MKEALSSIFSGKTRRVEGNIIPWYWGVCNGAGLQLDRRNVIWPGDCW